MTGSTSTSSEGEASELSFSDCNPTERSPSVSSTTSESADAFVYPCLPTAPSDGQDDPDLLPPLLYETAWVDPLLDLEQLGSPSSLASSLIFFEEQPESCMRESTTPNAQKRIAICLAVVATLCSIMCIALSILLFCASGQCQLEPIARQTKRTKAPVTLSPSPNVPDSGNTTRGEKCNIFQGDACQPSLPASVSPLAPSISPSHPPSDAASPTNVQITMSPSVVPSDYHTVPPTATQMEAPTPTLAPTYDNLTTNSPAVAALPTLIPTVTNATTHPEPGNLTTPNTTRPASTNVTTSSVAPTTTTNIGTLAPTNATRNIADLKLGLILNGIRRNPVTAPLFQNLSRDPLHYQGMTEGASCAGTPEECAISWSLYRDSLPLESNPVIIRRFALAAIYYSLGGQDWHNSSSWLTSTSYCGWYGLYCDPWETSVIEMDLSENNLEGQIPLEVALMDTLVILNLKANRVSGPLQGDTLAALPALFMLDLQNNSLTGPIPDNLLNEVKSLAFMFIHGNNFTGPFPTVYCRANNGFFLQEMTLDCSKNECDCCEPQNCFY